MKRIVVLVALCVSSFGSGGCGDPCEKLADRICEKQQDPKACDKSREEALRLDPEVCKHALTILDSLKDE